MLIPDVAHKAVFTNMPKIGFKNDRSFKDQYVWAVLPKIVTEGRSKLCVRVRVCACVCVCVWEGGGGGGGDVLVKYVNQLMTLLILKGGTNDTFNILKGPQDHLIGILIMSFIYLFECKRCQYRFPYVSRTKTKFRYRLNNYKSTHRKFRKS